MHFTDDLTVYVQLGADWDSENMKALFVVDGTDEKIPLLNSINLILIWVSLYSFVFGVNGVDNAKHYFRAYIVPCGGVCVRFRCGEALQKEKADVSANPRLCGGVLCVTKAFLCSQYLVQYDGGGQHWNVRHFRL